MILVSELLTIYFAFLHLDTTAPTAAPSDYPYEMGEWKNDSSLELSRALEYDKIIKVSLSTNLFCAKWNFLLASGWYARF